MDRGGKPKLFPNPQTSYRVEFKAPGTQKIHSTCLRKVNDLHAAAISSALITRTAARGYVPYTPGARGGELESLATTSGVQFPMLAAGDGAGPSGALATLNTAQRSNTKLLWLWMRDICLRTPCRVSSVVHIRCMV